MNRRLWRLCGAGTYLIGVYSSRNGAGCLGVPHEVHYAVLIWYEPWTDRLLATEITRENKITSLSRAHNCLFVFVCSYIHIEDMLMVTQSWCPSHHRSFGADKVNAGGVGAHLPVHLAHRAVCVLQHQLSVLDDHRAFVSHAHVTDGHFFRWYPLWKVPRGTRYRWPSSSSRYFYYS